MKDTSAQRFGMMGNLNNSISELIDKSGLTPPEVMTVLEMLSSDIKHLFMAKVGVSREKK
jgi:hypothetical protein